MTPETFIEQPLQPLNPEQERVLAPYQLFAKHYQVKKLEELYLEKFSKSSLRGTDRMNGPQFGNQAKSHIRVINRKCRQGIYRFAPYLEILRAKGKGKKPRVISVPTVRDRIVIYALKEIISNIFEDCIPKKLANTHVYEINKFLRDQSLEDLGFIKTDITNFYGSINQPRLIAKIKKRIKSRKILTLLDSAIKNPASM